LDRRAVAPRVDSRGGLSPGLVEGTRKQMDRAVEDLYSKLDTRAVVGWEAPPGNVRSPRRRGRPRVQLPFEELDGYSKAG